MLFAFSVFLSILSLYFLLMLLIFAGLLSLKPTIRNTSQPDRRVTVVIPFKNEVDHLPGIIRDLRAQTYPEHLFSVILVNDHSEDGSGELAASLIEDRATFSCMDLPPGKDGKKEAVSLALSGAASQWIIQTDADCRMGPGFITAQMQYLEENPSDLVAGLVTTSEGEGGFMEVFERLDLLALNGAAAGSYPYGRALMCSGANMLYNLELYRETRVFDPADRTGSGDDMFLLIGARKLHKKISFNPAKECIVYTPPQDNLRKLITQRIRWGAKSVFYRMPDIQVIAFLVAIVNILVFFSPVWIIINPSLTGWILAGIGSKIAIDFLVLAATSLKSGQSRSLLYYLPVALVYPVFLVTVIAGTIVFPPRWKGRKTQESLLR